ncbi:hypothetical protein NCCP28_28040 [Niallia sp. NCCP-28]|nr:hypothetical protein NCCP28_28040 [Niallia sp. NCCP-28]
MVLIGISTAIAAIKIAPFFYPFVVKAVSIYIMSVDFFYGKGYFFQQKIFALKKRLEVWIVVKIRVGWLG